jgi:hypothetical protein
VALEEVVNQRMAYQESNLGLLMEQDAKKLQQAYPYLSIK